MLDATRQIYERWQGEGKLVCQTEKLLRFMNHIIFFFKKIVNNLY